MASQDDSRHPAEPDFDAVADAARLIAPLPRWRLSVSSRRPARCSSGQARRRSAAISTATAASANSASIAP